MENSKLTFKDVYKLPLRTNKYNKIYTYSANGIMTFTNLINEDDAPSEINIDKILSILNGESESTINKDVTYEDCRIYKL